MNQVQTFAPTVAMPDGRTLTPPGWVWVLSFAIAGCEWAIREIDTPDFKEITQRYLNQLKDENLERQIADLEKRIAALKAQRSR